MMLGRLGVVPILAATLATLPAGAARAAGRAPTISFEGHSPDPAEARIRLAYERDPDARRTLFLAMAAASTPPAFADRVRAAAAAEADPFAATARAWGTSPDELEARFVQLLEAWRATLPAGEVEPWDWYYAAGDAARIVAPALTRDRTIAAAVRWCDDIGAPLDVLNVRLDLDPGPDGPARIVAAIVKAPRFSRGRYSGGRYRITGSIGEGGLYGLHALMRALGRAIHVAAIRAPHPADCAPPDDPAFEAALDAMIGDTAFDAGWLARYLQTAVPEGDGTRALLSETMLALCHALFERRMFADPEADPGATWSAIAERYLGVSPHPDLAWWAFSRDLVARPGSAVEKAWGAIVAADLRHRVLALKGPGAFDAPEPGLYVWLVPKLYGFGRDYDGPALAERFLGRPASIDPLLETISSRPAPE